MNISVVGTGYVGLVVGACLAQTGHDVLCADVDQRKIDRLKGGEIPIYEPGLENLVRLNLAEGRLRFTTDVEEAVRASHVIFIAVGTPPGEDGSADLQHVLAVARTIGRVMDGERIVITKSTVPVGTAARVRAAIEEQARHPVHVCSNPEFLKEGAAVEDFMKPDRVVLGVDDPGAAEVLRRIYEPFVRTGNEILLMDVASAEITKYAANAMLATRISFMNMIARLCEAAGANVDQVRLGIGSDKRIGPSFLFPGVGYGGSCLAGGETVLVRSETGTTLTRLGDLFRDAASIVRSGPGDPQPDVAWVDDLEVLSWSPEGPRWQRLQAVTRRWFDDQLIEVRTKLGRVVHVTPDHPFVVASAPGELPGVKLAEELTETDWLPLAFGRADGSTESPALNVVGALAELGFRDEEVIVRVGEGTLEGLEVGRLREGVAATGHPRGRHRAHDIAHTGALRLHELRAMALPTDGALLGTARNGTYVPTAFESDAAFWRVVGLYLAEGHMGRDGRRMRLSWSFHPRNEEALVEEVAGFWRRHGVKVDVRSHTTTRQVTVSSRILATWFTEGLRLGTNCYNHRLPDAVWTLSPQLQLALLSGLWHGDGSWSYVNGGPSVVLEWGTVSRELADGVVRILGEQGIGARTKTGRTAKSTVPAHWVVVAGAAQVERLIEFVKPSDREEVLGSIARQKKRIGPTGHRQTGGTAWVRVTELQRRPHRGWVYSVEVPGTETFVTTAGLVVHNCFPKDVKALVRTMREMDLDAGLIEAVEEVNEHQKHALLHRVVARFGEDLTGRRFAVWGLAFKPNTDDMREAPSLITIEGLLERGATISAHDPVAMEEARRHLGDRIEYAERNYDALEGADALVIHTEWHPYRRPDFPRMVDLMKQPVIFDGRNLYTREMLGELGFEYHSIGRQPVVPSGAER